jgi:hypothetical protein
MPRVAFTRYEDDSKPANFDDVDEDAAAAYAEVAERTEEPAAPAGRSRSSNQAEDDAPAERGGRKLHIVKNDDKEPKDDSQRPHKKSREEAEAEGKDGRDDKGRFVSKAGKAQPKADDNDEEDAGDDETSGKQDDQKAPVAGAPPPSFSPKTKAEWERLPEHVRADIIKRESEMQTGLKALQDYKDLKPWADMAAKHGTSIGKALEHYTGLENVLRQDMAKGFRIIAQNFGLSQAQAAEFFGKLAGQLGGKPAPAPAAGGSQGDNQGNCDDALMEALRPVLGPIMQELNGLKGQLSARQQAEVQASTKSLGEEIAKFAADPANKFYSDVEETITKLFETGMVQKTGNHAADLKTAYELAVRMTPTVQEALIEQRLQERKEADRKKEQEAADKAKAASRSITGSRAPGTVIKDRNEEEVSHEDDIEADVRKAYRSHAQV